MGSAALYQIAKRGKSVLGIDQFSSPHTNGSSHGETRIIRQAIGEGDYYVPLVLRSYELWRELEKTANQSLLTITGGLIVASKENQFLQKTILSAEKYRIDHRVLTPNQVKKEYPQFKIQLDELGYVEKEAGFLRPEKCLEAQLSLGKNLGANILVNEKVLDVLPEKNEILVKTEKGEYRAEKVIVSTGSWVNEFLPPKYRKFLKVYRQVLYWFDVRKSIQSFLPENFPIFLWELEDKGKHSIYGFPAINGLDGGIKIAIGQQDVDTTPEKIERTVSAKEIEEMYQEYIQPYFYGVSRKCLKAVTCMYAATPDNDFIIDTHPENKNIIIASPCSGHGFKHSSGIGEILAEIAIDGKSRLSISQFSFNRFMKN